MGMYIAKYQHFSHSVLKAETCNMIVRIANRDDLDQTTATEKSDIGLHYLPWLLSRQPMFEISEHSRNEFYFWSVHGIMNTSGLHINSKRPQVFDHDSMKRPKMEFIIFIFYISKVGLSIFNFHITWLIF